MKWDSPPAGSLICTHVETILDKAGTTTLPIVVQLSPFLEQKERIMRFAKLHKIAVSAIAALALVAVLAAFFQASQQTTNRSSANQDPQQDSRQGPKQASGRNRGGGERKWIWLSEPPTFLELVEVKNLDSDKWMEDLEIKVKNTSEKPICFIEFNVSVPGLKVVDATVGFDLHFGSPDLWHKSRPSIEDKLLEPGEEVVLTVKEAYKPFLRKVFERATDERGIVPSTVSQVAFYFYQTMFSDGTKYGGKQKLLEGEKKQSLNT
jgi:hypothetical protein